MNTNFEGMEQIIKAVNDKLESQESTLEYYRDKSRKDEETIERLEFELRTVEEQYYKVVESLEKRIKELETEWQGDESETESAGDF